jgi:hypothetical protein
MVKTTLALKGTAPVGWQADWPDAQARAPESASLMLGLRDKMENSPYKASTARLAVGWERGDEGRARFEV